MTIDPQDLDEIHEFLDSFAGLVRALEPIGHKEIIEFCTNLKPGLIEWAEKSEELENKVEELQGENYGLYSTRDNLEYEVSNLKDEISNLNNAIICLEQSKGRSRW